MWDTIRFDWLRALTVTALALVLVLLTTAGSCGSSGSQYRELGEGLGGKVSEGNVPGSYLYVADMETKHYWPNKAKYVDAIPKKRRVYIKDAETLAEFKGYTPGPL